MQKVIRCGKLYLFAIGYGLHLFCGIGKPSQKCKKMIIPDYISQRVQKPCTFVVNVTPTAPLCYLHCTHRFPRGYRHRILFTDSGSKQFHHLIICLFSTQMIGIERLHIRPKPFVKPEIPPVPNRNQVSPPLMGQFVLMQVVEISRFTKKSSIFETRSVSYDTLMLHSKVGCMSHTIFISTKGIGPQQLFKKTDLFGKLREKLFSLLFKLRKHPKRNIKQVSACTCVGFSNGFVGCDVKRNIVVIDGHRYKPLPGIIAIFKILSSHEATV